MGQPNLSLGDLASLVTILTAAAAVLGCLCRAAIYLRRKKRVLKDMVEGGGLDAAAIQGFTAYLSPAVDIYRAVGASPARLPRARALYREMRPGFVAEKGITVLLGDPGSGKSLLLQRLCCAYCQYHEKLREPFLEKDTAHPLLRRGVKYRQLCQCPDSAAILEDFAAQNLRILFLDGFDELVELNTREAGQVLAGLLAGMEQAAPGVRVVLSTRRELFCQGFKNPVDSLLSFSPRVQVVEICPFAPRDILRLYLKRGGSADSLRPRRGRHGWRMWRYLKKHGENSLFATPLFIPYADLLLHSNRQGRVLDSNEAYFIIADYWLEREWQRCWRRNREHILGYFRQRQADGDIGAIARLARAQYIRAAYAFLGLLCVKMAQSGESALLATEFTAIAQQPETGQKFGESGFYFLTRHLLHSQAGNTRYAFIHRSFYDFFMAKALVENLSIGWETRVRLLGEGGQTAAFYSYHLRRAAKLAEGGEMGLKYAPESRAHLARLRADVRYFEGGQPLGADTREVRLAQPPSMPVSSYLCLLPLAQKLVFGNFILDRGQIEAYMGARTLRIENHTSIGLGGIGQFGPLRRLALFGTEITDLADFSKAQAEVLEITLYDGNAPQLPALKEAAGVKKLVLDPGGRFALYPPLLGCWEPGRMELRALPGAREFAQSYLPPADRGDEVVFLSRILDLCRLGRPEGEKSPAFCALAQKIGERLYKRGFLERAVELFEQICTRWAGLPGESGGLHTARYWLGRAFCRNRQYRQAREPLEQGVRYWLGADEGREPLLWARCWLGAALAGEGRLEKAQEALEQNLAAASPADEEGPAPWLLATQGWRGAVLVQMGQCQEAARLLAPCLGRWQAAEGEEGEFALLTGHWLGLALAGNGEFREAAKQLEDVYKKRGKVLGEEHPETQVSLAELIKVLQKLLAGANKAFDGNEAEALSTQHQLGRMLFQAQRYHEAVQVFQENYGRRAQLLGTRHKDTLSAQHWLGTSLNKAKCYNDAIAVLQDNLNGRIELLGSNHVDTLFTQHWLGTSLEKAGQFNDAIVALQDNLDKFTQVLGTTCKDTLNTQYWLGISLHEAGRFDDAIAVLQDNLDRRAQVLGANHKNTLFTQHWLGKSLNKAGRFDDAIAVLRDSLDRRSQVLGSNHKDTLFTQHWLGTSLNKAGQFRDAIVVLQDNLDRFTQVLGTTCKDTLNTQYWLGISLHEAGRYDDAVAVLQENLDRRSQALGANHEDSLSTQHWLGTSLNEAGRYSDAIPVLQENLDRRSQVLGSNHKDTLFTQHWLGKSLNKAGRFDDAIAVLRDNLDRRSQVLSSNHKDTLFTQHWLGTSLNKAGQFRDAIVVLQDNLDRFTQVLGTTCKDTLNTQYWLGISLHEAGRFDDAIAVLQENLDRRSQVLGANHKSTLYTQHWLGKSLNKAGRFADAIAVLRDNLDRRSQILGSNHKDTLFTQHWLGTSLNKAGQFRDAIVVLQDNLDRFTQVLGTTCKDTLNTQYWLGISLNGAGRYNDAIPVLQDNLDKRSQVLGSNHKSTLYTQHWLGSTYYKAGRFDDAITAFQATLDGQTQVLGGNHTETLLTQNWQGKTLLMAGRFDEAIVVLQDNLDKRTQVLGPAHPDTRSTQRWLDKAEQAAKSQGEAQAALAGKN